jgi:DNA-binding NarL/FixJ family response regulator
MPNSSHILLVENDEGYRSSLKALLELEGYDVFTASNPLEAEKLIKEITVHLIITDLRVTDDENENDFSGLKFASSIAPTIPKIIVTAFPTVRVVREALSPRLDHELPAAIDFISKTAGPQQLLEAIENIFQNYINNNVPQVKVGGALTTQDASRYIERQAEQEAIRDLKNREYILIFEPRQQGKTSLINYIMRHPKLNDTKTIYIDTSTLDRSTQENWLKTICSRILDKLQEEFGLYTELPNIPKNSTEWRQFLFSIATLAHRNEIFLILALDEIGAVPIPNPIDFFSVIRDIYNSRQAEPVFFHLTFLLVGSFHPRDLIEDDKISPFNIAKRIRLYDFTQNQVRQLVGKLKWSDEQTEEIVERIYYWTNGQPYLTQKLCETLNSDTSTENIDISVRALQWEDDNHLPNILKLINGDEIKNYIRRVLSGEKIIFFPAANKQQTQMELIGILKADADGFCTIRNHIYERAFFIYLELTENLAVDIRKEKTMISPEQQIAMQILKEAFSFIADELKQRWKSKGEKPQNEMSVNNETNLGISESLQSALIKQVENLQDESHLKMINENLKTAIMMAEKYNKRWNKYRQQLPSAIDTAAIEIQIDEAENNREKAIKEIKAVLEKLSNEEITVSKRI